MVDNRYNAVGHMFQYRREGDTSWVGGCGVDRGLV